MLRSIMPQPGPSMSSLVFHITTCLSGILVFSLTHHIGPSSCITDPVEIHDSGRRPPHEESPLQADAGPQHALRGPQKDPPDRDPTAE